MLFRLCFIIVALHGLALGQLDSTPIPHREPCAGEIDLMIVVDGSYSVTKPNFELVKEWIKDLAAGFSIEHGHVQIGVVQYSYWYSNRPLNRQKYIRTELPLGRYKTLRRFNQAVSKIRYQGYRTYTAHAINKTVDFDFQSPRSRYPEARRAIVLLTDGKATDADELAYAVQHAENDAGVVMFAVGVGNYSIDELRLITHGHNNRIFELRNFTQLATIVFKLPQELQGVCDCYEAGSEDNQCDVCTRECRCKVNVIGRRCSDCVPGTYGIRQGNGCKDCGCHPEGTLTTGNATRCNQYTGICMCKESVVGEKCDRCREGFTGFPKCKICDCNGFSTACDDKTGTCINCSGGRIGRYCETCPSGHFISADGSCQPCECNGNIDMFDPHSCDINTGECRRCLFNTDGDNCERCLDFHYRNPIDNFCTPCDCNIHGTDPKGNDNCDAGTGQCVCRANITGLRCDQCVVGLYDFPTCDECQCNGWADVCHPETGVCIQCKGGRVGMRCQSCPPGKYISPKDDSCQPCNCNGNIDIRDPQSCNARTGKCMKCLYHTAGENCERCEDFYFRDAMDGSCRICNCDYRGSVKENCTAGQICRCDHQTGQCPCKDGVTGERCSDCKDGFWGFSTMKGCQECGCSTVGSIDGSCDKRMGRCRCQLYHSGQKCDKCVKGFEPNEEGKCKRKEQTINDEPDDQKETTTVKPTTTPTVRSTTTRRPRRTTRPATSGCYTGCYLSWPSYCRGWLCKTRWPYHRQQYSPYGCSSTNLSCRMQHTARKQVAVAPKRPLGKTNSYGHGSFGYNRRFSPRRPVAQKVNSRRKPAPTLASYNLYRRRY